MSSTNLEINTLPISTQELLMQALNWGITNAYEKPIMFPPLTDESITPTYAQALYSIEIIQQVLQTGIIYSDMKDFIASLLNFLAWDIETWLEGRDSAQSEKEAAEEYSFKFGINITPVTLIKLKSLARILSPQSEIYSSVYIVDGITDKNFPKFIEAFYDTILKSNLEKQINYGQYNIGIVIDGMLYDFPTSHPFITSLYTLSRRFISNQLLGKNI